MKRWLVRRRTLERILVPLFVPACLAASVVLYVLFLEVAGSALGITSHDVVTCAFPFLAAGFAAIPLLFRPFTITLSRIRGRYITFDGKVLRVPHDRTCREIPLESIDRVQAGWFLGRMTYTGGNPLAPMRGMSLLPWIMLVGGERVVFLNIDSFRLVREWKALYPEAKPEIPPGKEVAVFHVFMQDARDLLAQPGFSVKA